MPHARALEKIAVASGRHILSPMSVNQGWAVALLVAAGCVGPAGRSAAPGASASTAPGAAPGGASETGDRTFVYVGLAGGEIATFHLDVATGELARRGTVAVGRAPSSLAFSGERQVVIAVDETTGQATSLAVNAKTGALTPVGRAATGGAQPSGATVDRTGKYVLAAHRGSGTVSVLAIKTDGTLNAIDTFASGAGAHAVAVHPTSQVTFVSNFRAGTVSQFIFNTGTGMLTPKAGPALELPAGSGPTRFACHPSGRWVYLLDETADAISVHVFDEDLKGLSTMSSQIVSTLPEGLARAKSRPGDLVLGSAGRFLYATNRGPDSVVTFAVQAGGTLKLVGHESSGGRAPSALAVDPSGAYLFVANEGSKNLGVFRLDATTGAPTARRAVALSGAPLAVLVARP
jgi:6-phosphogluconolactonase